MSHNYTTLGNYDQQNARRIREDGMVVNLADYLYEGTTGLHQQVGVEPTTQFAYKSIFPISAQRDSLTQTNNGTVTQVNGSEYRVQATADAGSIAELQTKQNGDYIPGYIFVAGLAVRIPTQPTGNGKVEWGYFNSSNGHFLRYDSSGLKYVIRKASSDTVVDTLDHDPSGGFIYWFPMMYYGYAWSAVAWGDKNSENDYRMRERTRYYPDGETMFNQANMPITMRVESDGQQLDAFVGGRHMSVHGKNDRIFRMVSEIRKEQGSIGSTNYYPLVSVQAKSSLKQVYVELGGLTIIADADLEVAIFRNGTLTGATFGTPADYAADEVATEWDNSATAISGGDQVFGDIIQSGTGAQRSFRNVDLPDKPIVNGDTWSFCVRRISGTGATATLTARVRENW